jgi:predicted HicB family RNase H-like nuclease
MKKAQKIGYKAEHEKKSNRLNIRFDKEEYALLVAQASEQNIRITTLAHKLIVSGLQKNGESK